MYPDISLWLALLFVVGGLVVLAWSADLFIDAASTVARVLGVSPFIIGMVIIGFGTSAPELCVSALSGMSGHSNLSLGNAYGSAIFNIACILGLSAVIRPLTVKPAITFVAAPAVAVIATFSCLLMGLGGGFSRMDGLIELLVFAVLLPLYCWFDQKNGGTQGVSGGEATTQIPPVGKGVLLRAWIKLFVGLALLVGSSHVLVWGSVDIARQMGVSELLIGLTIVAVGTSLPELASAVASARKGEHEFVLGNIVGSNLFNTLAGVLSPFKNASPYIVWRDLPTLIVLSLSISIFGLNVRDRRAPGQVTRLEGAIWLLVFLVYAGVMIAQELG